MLFLIIQKFDRANQSFHPILLKTQLTVVFNRFEHKDISFLMFFNKCVGLKFFNFILSCAFIFKL